MLRARKVDFWLGAITLLLVVVHPLAYLTNYAGDAEIHLVYGSHAAEGHYFEFNPGEKSPGVTSPGYMLILGALFKILPASIVPVVVKALDILFWYALVGLVALLMRALSAPKPWAWLAALVAGLLPGSAYNATIGMENGVFAFCVVLVTYLALRWGWFGPGPRLAASKELVLGLLIGCGCWLRPEGFIVAVLLFMVRWQESLRSPVQLGAAVARSATSLLPAVLIGCGVLWFHYSQTGYLAPGSGVARVTMGRLESWRLGPVSVSPKFAVRLAVYLPLGLGWILGSILIVRDRLAAPQRRTLLFCTGLSWLFFFLYSTLLPAAHLARYAIFVMPFVIVIAVLAAMWLWEGWTNLFPRAPRWRLAVFSFAGLMLFAVLTSEIAARRNLQPYNELAKLMRVPRERSEYSDRMFALLGRPTKVPVSLAYQEVQMRYWLDERFIVRSLDGRTDPALLRYVSDGNFDHPGYLRDREVDFVIETPNYNRSPERWSLARLERLAIGEAEEVDGLRFVRRPSDRAVCDRIYEIQRLGGVQAP